MKNLSKYAFGALAAGLCLCSTGATALTIDAATLGVGTIAPGSPSSPADELVYAQNMVTVYNSSTSPQTIAAHTYTIVQGSLTPAPALPAPVSITGNLGSGGATSFTLDLTTTAADYLLVKWADLDALYDIRGLSGSFTVQNDIDFNANRVAQNFSHYALLDVTTNHVPDGGMTLVLLGMGLSGLSFVARYRKS